MAQEQMENSAQKINLLTVDPIVILNDVLKRWYIIIFVVVLAVAGTYIYSDRYYKPQYTTNTTFVISSQGNSTTVFQNMNAASNLAAVFSELINSSILREKVLDSLGMTSFNGRISSSVVPETNLLTMQVTASDPRTAFLVTRAIIENHSIVSERVMGEIAFEILQKPVVPTTPSNPKNAAGKARRAALIAFAAIVALLAAASYSSDRVRSRREAEKKLNCTVLGTMSYERKKRSLKDILKKKKTGLLVTKPGTSFRFIEEMRKVRHRTEQHMPEGAKVLLVTSVLENEGKSTIAVNLALSLAQKRYRVLLVDADMKKPACRKILEMQDEVKVSLSDVVKGKAKLKEAMLQYPLQKRLYVLLQAKSVHGADKLINSNSMKQLFETMRDVFDYIIVDTSPLSVSADTNAVANLCDASVLVVRQNAAMTGWIQKGIDAISTNTTQFLGIILNGVRKSRLSDQSAYGYGSSHYGYGKYGRYGKYGKYGYYGRYDKYYGHYAGTSTPSGQAEQ